MTAASHIVIWSAITYEIACADKSNRWSCDDCEACGSLGKYDSKSCMMAVCPACDEARWAAAARAMRRVDDAGLKARWARAVRLRELRMARAAVEMRGRAA